eukprot:TRINITY_DN6420_c0_g1_i5.p1 TRINITY_DN6420_c0_g1~~TRINITY_DN6420_c0_g1_i5.p1  ORF type:complete len:378 (+),score=33.85 TRINITY_DN6420_c0_g1_i5:191-1324(+)
MMNPGSPTSKSSKEDSDGKGSPRSKSPFRNQISSINEPDRRPNVSESSPHQHSVNSLSVAYTSGNSPLVITTDNEGHVMGHTRTESGWISETIALPQEAREDVQLLMVPRIVIPRMRMIPLSQKVFVWNPHENGEDDVLLKTLDTIKNTRGAHGLDFKFGHLIVGGDSQFRVFRIPEFDKSTSPEIYLNSLKDEKNIHHLSTIVVINGGICQRSIIFEQDNQIYSFLVFEKSQILLFNCTTMEVVDQDLFALKMNTYAFSIDKKTYLAVLGEQVMLRVYSAEQGRLKYVQHTTSIQLTAFSFQSFGDSKWYAFSWHEDLFQVIEFDGKPYEQQTKFREWSVKFGDKLIIRSMCSVRINSERIYIFCVGDMNLSLIHI